MTKSSSVSWLGPAPAPEPEPEPVLLSSRGRGRGRGRPEPARSFVGRAALRLINGGLKERAEEVQ